MLVPLIEKYLASIPSTGIPPARRVAEITALKVVFPSEPVIEDVKVICLDQKEVGSESLCLQSP